MDLMAYWKWSNYIEDTRDGLGYNFNSGQQRLHSVLDVGDTLWLVSMRPKGEGGGTVLLGRLVIKEKFHNPPGFVYGPLGVQGDDERSEYFDPHGPDVTSVLYGLTFEPPKPLSPDIPVGQSLQALRALSAEDSRRLAEWSAQLPLHPRLTPKPRASAPETRTRQVTYGSRELLQAFLDARQYRNAAPELHDYYEGLWNALSSLFGVTFTAEDAERHQFERKTRWSRQYLRDLVKASEDYAMEHTPFSGYLEIPQEMHEFYRPHASRIGTLSQEKKQALFDFMLAIMHHLYDGMGQTFTSDDLRRVGFSDVNPPDPWDFA